MHLMFSELAVTEADARDAGGAFLQAERRQKRSGMERPEQAGRGEGEVGRDDERRDAQGRHRAGIWILGAGPGRDAGTWPSCGSKDLFKEMGRRRWTGMQRSTSCAGNGPNFHRLILARQLPSSTWREVRSQVAKVQERETQELSRLDKLIAGARELMAEVKERTVAVAQNITERVERFRDRFERWREGHAGGKPEQHFDTQPGSRTRDRQEQLETKEGVGNGQEQGSPPDLAIEVQ